MEYTSLNDDILSILHSSDYDYELKMYDEEGNTTLDSDNIKWLYIKNKNIMIEMPSTEDPVLCFWKETGSEDKDMIKVIQRVREISVLNGVKVEIRTYNNLDRRKIYNIIKTSIAKEGGMMESAEKDVSKALYELSNIVANTKRPSDFYINESMAAQNKRAFMNDVITSVTNIDVLNKKPIVKLLSMTMMESSYKTIKNITKAFETKQPEEYKLLKENVENIESIGSFVKQRYLKNIEITKTPHVIKMFENVMVYPVKTKMDKENLIKAYNHLVSVCEGAKTGTDLLRVIRNNKLCETYKVSKNDLLDMWLSKSVNEKIEPKTLLVFENVDGNRITYSIDMKTSCKQLAEQFNKNGFKEDDVTNNIVNETLKLNGIMDLVENYYYNTSIRKYASLLKEMYIKCVESINSGKSSEIKTLDYSKELALLEGKVGFKHPGLKYIAMYEAKINDENTMAQTVEKIKDEKILREGLSMVMPYGKTKDIARSIIKSNLCKVRDLKENKEDKLSAVKCLFDNIYSTNVEAKNAVDDCLFLIGASPKKYTKDRQKFVETLKKYVI